MLPPILSHVFTVGSNAFGRTVQGCWLPTTFAFSPFTFPIVRRLVPSGSERTIPILTNSDWKQRFPIDRTTETGDDSALLPRIFQHSERTSEIAERV